MSVTIYTIGHSGKAADEFFPKLSSPVWRVVDIRRNPNSQLAAFARGKDLPWLLQTLYETEYVHESDLAPSEMLLRAYRDKKIGWAAYTQAYLAELAVAEVERLFSPDLMHNSCLLCSEHTPEQCHRRLAAEYLQKAWSDHNVEIIHL